MLSTVYMESSLISGGSALTSAVYNTLVSSSGTANNYGGTTIISKKTYIVSQSTTTIGSGSVISNSGYTDIFFDCGSSTSNACTTISANAFQNWSSLVRVDMTFATNLTTINQNVFNSCSALTTINLPPSLTTLTTTTANSGIFQGCSALTNITIPSLITSIPQYMFYGCSALSTIIFASNRKLTTIGDYAFYQCAFPSINIPYSLTSIGNYSFSTNTQLQTIRLFYRGTNISINTFAFSGCPNLLTVYLENPSITAGTGINTVYTSTSFIVNATIIPTNTYIISASTTTVGVSGGSNTTPLTNNNYTDIYFDYNTGGTNACTEIYPYAFSGWTTLARIDGTFATSLTQIDTYAFNGCSYLMSANLQNATSLTTIYPYAFNNCSNMGVVNLPTSFTTFYTNGTTTNTTTANGAFYGCSSLITVNIPAGVTNIPAYTFYGCSYLQNIIFASNNTITNIGDYAFYGCNFSTIALPYSITYIGNYSFASNTALTTITVKYKCTQIDTYAFNGCTSLTTAYLEQPATSAGAGVVTVYSSSSFPVGTTKTSTKTYVISSTSTSVGLSSSGTTPLTNASYTDLFFDYGSGTSNACVQIYQYAFSGWSSLVRVDLTFATNITTINQYTFNACTGLKTVTFSPYNNIITSIGNYAFNQCAFTSIILPYSLKTIGQNAFSSNSFITSIQIPFRCLTIGINAFNNCPNLTKAYLEQPGLSTGININTVYTGTSFNTSITTIVNTYTYIVSSINKSIPFVTSTNLYTDLFFDYDVTNTNACTIINAYAFNNSSTLTRINTTFATSLQIIDSYAFNSVTSLKSITFPQTLTNIGSYAFYGCTGITNYNTTKLNLNTIIQIIPSYCFYGLGSSLASSTLSFMPPSIISIGPFSYYANNISSMIIPPNVVSIGSYSFCNSYAITSISFVSSKTCMIIDTNGFKASTNLLTITYPTSLYSLDSGTSWNGTTFTSGGGGAFYGCSKIFNGTNILLPQNLTIIPPSTFSACTGYTGVIYPDGLLAIGSNAFYNCPLISSFNTSTSISIYPNTIYFTSTIQYIGNYVFGGTSSNYLNNGVTNINMSNISASCKLSSGIFQYTNATNILMPNNNSGTSMFYGCSNNFSITFPSGYNKTTMGTSMFSLCTGIVSFTVPNSVTSLPDSTFQGCTSLKSINLPSGLTTLGANVFYGCTSLISITIPAGVSSIDGAGTGNGCFNGCTSLTSVIFASLNKLGSIGTSNMPSGTFQYCAFSTIQLPYSLTTIGSYAFANNNHLTSLNLPPKCITTNGASSYAFAYCPLLTTIYAESTLITAITQSTFASYCTGSGTANGQTGTSIVKKITYIVPYTTTTISPVTNNNYTDIFFDYGSSTSNACITIQASAFQGWTTLLRVDMTYATNLTTINTQAFYGCSNLNTINLPSSLTTFNTSNSSTNNGIFQSCTSLTNINIPAKITNIPQYMFANCSSLSNVTFSSNNTLTSIGTYAFSSCSFSTINIPYSVISVDNYAFQSNTNLQMIRFYYRGNNITLGTYVFSGCSQLLLAFLENPSTSSGSGVNTIYTGGNNTFPSCTTISQTNTYIISASTTTVGVSGGSNTTPLTNNNYTDIYFDYNTGGTNACTEIYPYAFSGWTTLARIDGTFATSLTQIDTYAFNGCSYLMSANLQNATSLTTIYPYAFNNCSNMGVVNLPTSFTTFYTNGTTTNTTTANGAFYGCSSLITVNIPAGVTNIPAYTFYGCSYLQNIIFASNNTITNIGDYAFYGCNFSTIALPYSITYIGNYSFASNTALTTITVKYKCTQIDTYAFNGCTSLTTAYLEQPATSAGAGVVTVYSSSSFPVGTTKTSTKTYVISSTSTSVGLSSSGTTPLTNASYTDLFFDYGSGTSNACVQIYQYAFSGWTTLVRVDLTFATNMTIINQYAFNNCTGLKTLIFPIFNNFIQVIGDYAFYHCPLNSLSLPYSLTTIGLFSFASNTYITTVTIPYKCATVGDNAFNGCTSLTSVFIELPGTSANNGINTVYSTSSFNNVTPTPTYTYAVSSSATNVPLMTNKSIYTNLLFEYNATNTNSCSNMRLYLWFIIQK